MHKRFFVSVLILVTAGLIGCSSSKEYYVDPSYTEEKVNASVLVLPIQRDWFGGSFSHTFGSLSGQGETAFYNSFEPLLSNSLESSIKMIDSNQSFDDKNFEQKKLKFGEDSTNVLIPTETSTFDSPDFQPKVVLLLDQYYFLQKEKTTGSSSYAGHEEGITRTILYFETKYIFWDTDQKKAIAWGSTDSSVMVDKSDQVDSGDYHDVLSKAVEKMSEQGPLL